MSELKVTGLTKSYGATRVLNGVDLTVPVGITSVLGSSGCGKTTLLRIIAGFLDPDAGSVRLGTRALVGEGRTVPAHERHIGYVPQEGALFPHLDVRANIAFGLPRRERKNSKVGEMLELVELPSSAARRFPHELSGGQQQRVALARALASDPAVVLLDEPFSSLDASLREDTGRAVARALRARNATALLVTHDQGEALSLADQVAVMAAGRFLQVASPDELYLSPATPGVAAFVGNAVLIQADATGDTATSSLGVVRLRTPATGPVLLAIRPEQVQVRPIGDATGPAVGRVVEVSYFGHDATVRTSVGDHGAVVTARVTADGVPVVGSRVSLTVSGAVIAFPAGQAT
ncbi:ABC transporter [Nocardioides psychrotolerans]|uniref:ABC-type quaternary amine transporter n=1 Tax=Nocardioides psychrotolerans TaxID=1005945 RepID=A0A1I3QWQ7_9ACTN|nr:ABC transporter ATP-binding protein [Nocardioides psychrotolerans]GEP40268.1 ABC transporter [Nocardioides psychrotolerans]SFJ38518.1 iron(III) transport system ATP-binding protein [Nocardioides psychrotolerans]